MEKTVYLDLYFLTNFLMDILCLKISARIMSETSKNSRAVIAALSGALYSVLALTVLPKGLMFAVLWLAVALLMIKISIPCKGLSETAGTLLAFFLCTSLSGGIIEGVSNLCISIFGTYLPYNLLSITLCIIGLIAFIPFSHKAKSTAKIKVIKLKLCLLGNEYCLNCLVDSGNLAKEPISGLDVMILSKNATCSQETKRIIREKMLPFYCITLSTLGGKKLLYGVRPDYISSQNKKTNKIIICTDDDTESFCGNDAIIPSGIF